jgi:hypothetical protein
MTWAPGQSGNPKGYAGPRERKKKEVFKLIEGLNHDDALVTLSTLQNDKTADPGLRIAAASALAPYCHPKMQATPTPRYVELQIDVPEFTNVSVAEDFLARILSLVAKGHLDIQQGQELAALAKMYIDSQYARDELQFKINPPEQHDQIITITGGLPALPGTQIDMPKFNGHVADARALAAPTDVIPSTNQVPETTATELLPTPGELKAIGPHPLQKHHFDPPEEPGKNSPNGGGEPCT